MPQKQVGILDIYLSFFKKNQKNYTLYILLSCFTSLDKVLVPHLYGKILDSTRSGDTSQGLRYFILLNTVWVLSQTVQAGLGYMDTYLIPSFYNHVRETFYGIILDGHSTNYKELDVGNIQAKMMTFPGALADYLIVAKHFIFSNVVTNTFNVIYLGSVHPLIGLSFMGCISVIGASLLSYFSQCKTVVTKTMSKSDETQELIVDAMSNLISIYTSDKVRHEKERMAQILHENLQSESRGLGCHTRHRIFASGLFTSTFLLVSGCSFWLYRKKVIQTSQFISAFMITYSSLGSLAGTYWIVRDLIDVLSRIKIVTEYIEALPSVPEPPLSDNPKTKGFTLGRSSSPVVAAASSDNIVEWRNVSLSYDVSSSSKNQVLKNVSLRIPRGAKMVIMGKVGSGKSTLAKTLVALHSNYTGDIFFNGANIQETPLQVLRQRIAYIPQNPSLFNRTLWENLTYTLPPNHGVTRDHIYQLLQNAQMSYIADVFRKSMDKPVGKNGSHLSGGQRQMVWIIRALLNESTEVMILDEPTSALDAASAKQVISFVNNTNKTVIIITHDSTVAQSVGYVVMLSEGRLVS